MDVELSSVQKKTLAGAVTLLAVVFMLMVFGVVLFWVGRFLSFFANVLMPIAVAGIAALVLKPVYEWVYHRVGERAVLAVALVFAALLVPLGAFLWFFGSLLVEQLAGLLRLTAEWGHVVAARVVELWPHWLEELQEHTSWKQLGELAEERTELIINALLQALKVTLAVGQSVWGWLAGLFSWIIFPVYLGFFLTLRRFRPQQLEELMPFLRQELRHDIVHLVVEFVNILVSFFRGQLVVAFLQGLLYAIGFSLIGLQYGFLLGLVLGLLNIIPYLGSIVGLAVMIPLGFFQEGGGLTLAVGAVIVFSIVQAIESYLLTPRIMGDRTGLHPVAIIVAIFFWGTAFGGIWGMILAIPLTAFGVVCWRLLKEKYMREIL